MVGPDKTEDGWDVQMQTNHLSHFLLVQQLFENVQNANGRIVTHSSMAHAFGKLNSDNLNNPGSQVPLGRFMPFLGPSNRYGASKLANILFSSELARRLESKGISNVTAVCAHPGYASTDLQRRAILPGWKFLNTKLAQSAEDGSLPLLHALTQPHVSNGDFYGPSSMGERSGPPTKVMPKRDGKSEETARKLWEASESATGVKLLST